MFWFDIERDFEKVSHERKLKECKNQLDKIVENIRHESVLEEISSKQEETQKGFHL